MYFDSLDHYFPGGMYPWGHYGCCSGADSQWGVINSDNVMTGTCTGYEAAPRHTPYNCHDTGPSTPHRINQLHLLRGLRQEK